MAFTLRDVAEAARDQHPALHRSRIPNGPVARFCTDAQNALIAKLTAANPYALQQSAVVTLAFDASAQPGTAGAGTDSGVPGALADDDTLAAVQQASGTAVEVSTESADGAVVHVAERVVTSATATTVTSTGAGRTVDADIGRCVAIVAGTGAGQIREVTANTAETWSFDDAWTTNPDDASVMIVVTPVYVADETAGLVTALPATRTTQGYAVKLTAQGVPYLDFAAPLVATVETGVPLPAMTALLGGTVYDADGCPSPLTVTSAAHRWSPARGYAVYVVGESVRLCGDASDWADVASLELHYAPTAPAFTALTDYFLLPDAARPAVVAQLAAFMALRVAGTEGIAIDAAAFQAKADVAERAYLAGARLTQRTQTTRMRGMD